MGVRSGAVWLAAGVLVGGGAAVWSRDGAGPAVPTVLAEPRPAPTASASLRYAPNAPQLAAIRVAAVQGKPLPAARPMYGRVVYDEDVTARVTAAVAGRVVAVRGKLGEHVARGAVLAVLDSPDVATAQADQAKAVADEQSKRDTLARVGELVAGDTAPRKDLEAAEAELRIAGAETVRAAQKLHNLGVDIAEQSTVGQFGLRSPVAGTIVERRLNQGMEVRPDLADPLYTVTDPDRLWVMADIPDDVVAMVRLGVPVRIRADAWPGIEFSGTVDAIPSAVDAGSRRLQARCRVRNVGGRLKADMLVRVAFLADQERRAVEVPNAALVLQGARQLVIVQTAPGVFVRREVDVGVAGPDSSYVTAGLADGDRVVTEGALLLLGEFPTVHAR